MTSSHVEVPGLVHHFAKTLLDSAYAGGRRELAGMGDFACADRLKPADLAQILRRIPLQMGDEFFGLTRSGCAVGTFRLASEICVLSSTLAEGLARAFSFYAMVSGELRFGIETKSNETTITVHHSPIGRSAFLGELWLYGWHRLAEWLSGEELPISRASFSYRPGGDVLEYREVFGRNLAFRAGATQMTLPHALLERRPQKKIGDLIYFLAPKSVDLVTMRGVRRSMRSAIKARLRGELEGSYSLPTLEDMAQQFGMSGQTLRRRLEAEGTSYSALKRESRQDLVLRSLGDPTVPINRLAAVAGFAEPNGLARAVKLWTGMSLREYRERSQTQLPS